MDALQYDIYGSYSDSSCGPRTPSPHISLTHSPVVNYKQDIDTAPMKPIVYLDPIADDHLQHGIATHDAFGTWHSQPIQYSTSSGSLLGELYEHDLQPHHEQPFPDVSYASQQQQQQHVSSPYPLPQRAHLVQHHDISAMRRATYPFARQERDDLSCYAAQPFLPQDSRRPEQVYTESPPMLERVPQHLSHHQSFHSFDHRVKLEDSAASMIVPSQILYRSQSLDQMHSLPLLPHPPHPIQLTDDANSKETHCLRRRCTNCSQTEPPSWRRSTLNPGKIVCNKCGLYERTHLRPRPLRFDELRTGNKSRKAKKCAVVKTEVETSPLMRRTSVSSASSVHSSSDWDDSVSVLSSGSAPPSSFNSPSPNIFSVPLERMSQSPTLLPADGGIRLPNVDIASLSVHGSPSSSGEFAMPPTEYYMQHSNTDAASVTSSLPGSPSPVGSPSLVSRVVMPDMGWQTVPVDLPSPEKRGLSLLRDSIVA